MFIKGDILALATCLYSFNFSSLYYGYNAALFQHYFMLICILQM